jgi:tRNA1Val (adenine37-N6)-methyltransferase
MQPDGRFALVLPVNVMDAFLEEAEKAGLYLHKQMTIIPIEGKEPNRVNLELGFGSLPEIQKETFVIRDANKRFTAQYKDFLKDYYLGL